MKYISSDELTLNRLNQLVADLEVMLRYYAYSNLLLSQTLRRYRELEVEYNRLLHSDNMKMLRMYQDAYEHLMLLLEADDCN